MTGISPAKVLITGAAGNLGRKLRKHLESGGRHELTLLDRRAGDGVLTADLGTYDETWIRCFQGQDVIVHLAADPRPWSPWESLQNNNVDALLNVFRAAVENGAKRVVFAKPWDLSETRRVLGYEPQDRIVPVKPSLPVRLNRRVARQLRRWRRGLIKTNVHPPAS